MGPHSLFDEGIDRCLDLIQETAAINAVMVYSQTYHMEMRRPTQTLATDHGVPLKRNDRPQTAASLDEDARPVLPAHRAASSAAGQHL